MHPLFREPLRFDVLTWLWWVLLAGVYVAHLRLDTWVSAWAFVVAGVVVASAFVLFVALLRYLVDGPQTRVEGARSMREVLGIDVLPGVGEWNRAGAPAEEPVEDALEETVEETVEVTAALPAAVARDEVTVAIPVEEPAAPTIPVAVAAAPAAAAPAERPRARRLEVSEVRIVAGRPVTVTWSFDGADHVVVDGRPGFPSHGQTTVAVRETRPVVVLATNAAGVTVVETPEILVVADEAALPVPAPASEPAPAPAGPRGPSVHRLQIDLGATTGGSPSALAQLDRVLAAQDRMRASSPALPVLGVPESFTRWLRGAPQRRFVREGAYLPPIPALQQRPVVDEPPALLQKEPVRAEVPVEDTAATEHAPEHTAEHDAHEAQTDRTDPRDRTTP